MKQHLSDNDHQLRFNNLVARPFRVLLYTGIFLLVFAGFGEVFSRIRFANDPNIANPLSGEPFVPVVPQWARLKDYVSRFGDPDCVFFGSSLVQTRIDPQLVTSNIEHQLGRSFKCYNFGMDGSSLSSTVPMALLILKTYHPSYIILGLEAQQVTARHADPTEDHLQDNSWLNYMLGKPSLSGWAIENSILVRSLAHYAKLIFPLNATTTTPPQNVATNAPVARLRPVPRRVFNNLGYGPLLQFQDSSPLFTPRLGKWDPGVIDPIQIDHFQQLLDATRNNHAQLIVVQMPVSQQDLGAEQELMSDVMNYIRRSGTPFLSSEGLAPLPSLAFSDVIHFQIVGSQMFSKWLGETLGMLLKENAIKDVLSPVWTPKLEKWPEPAYLTTLGLSAESNVEYAAYTASFSLVPPDAIVFAPGKGTLDRRFLQALLGFDVEWFGKTDPLMRQQSFLLMALLGRARYGYELTGTGDSASQLGDWGKSLDPTILEQNGIGFVLCRSELASPQIDHCPVTISEHPSYTLIGKWDFQPLVDQYALYKVNISKQ